MLEVGGIHHRIYVVPGEHSHDRLISHDGAGLCWNGEGTVMPAGDLFYAESLMAGVPAWGPARITLKL